MKVRPSDALNKSTDAPASRISLLLDTNVYIHAASGTLPAIVGSLVERSTVYHCSVCVSEIVAGIANGNPRHPAWDATRDHYEAVLGSITSQRILTPDETIWLDAGILAGTLARIQGLQRHKRKEALNDALILLTAAKHGLPVLTSDRDDFDLLQQLAPETMFYWY